MLNNFASTQGGGTDTVTTTMILDGTIANADVAADAAIDSSKINFANTVEIESSSGDQIFEMDNNAANSSNFQIQNGAGNARTDLYLDGSAVITLKGQSVGIGDTSPSYALDVNDTGRFTSDLIVGGNLTVGDGGAEDQKIVFDGNAQDFYVGLDDTTDDLVIGLGSAVGTTAAISINEDQDVTIADGAIDFDVASHDGTNGLKLGGTLVTASATEVNLLDGKTAIGDTLLGTAQTFTAGQRGEITTLSPGATVTIDMADSNNFTLTLDQATAMANPSNDTAGQSGSIFMIQDGTGSRTASWGTDWEFAGGTAPTLTTTASAVDRVDYVIRSSSSIQAVATLNLS